MISILALVYGLRNIFLFLLTYTMLSYELVCSWHSYSFVNVGQLLRPDCISHPCPMIRARMCSRLCRGWKNIASTCDLLLIRRVHSVAGLITSAFERIAHTFDSYWLGVWIYGEAGVYNWYQSMVRPSGALAADVLSRKIILVAISGKI